MLLLTCRLHPAAGLSPLRLLLNGPLIDHSDVTRGFLYKHSVGGTPVYGRLEIFPLEQGGKHDILTPPHEPYTELLLSSVPEMDPDWLDDLMERRRRGVAPTADSIN